MIGGGFVGLEIAAAARRLSADVPVIEAFPRLLTRRVPVEIARALELRHRKEGVRFGFDTQVAAILRTALISPTAASSRPISSWPK